MGSQTVQQPDAGTNSVTTAIRSKPVHCQVEEKVGHVRRRVIGQTLAGRVLWTGIIGLLFLSVAVFADFIFELPFGPRAFALSVLVIGVVVLLARAVIRSRRFSMHDAAAAVESQYPFHGQRIRTALDYQQTDAAHEYAPASPGMVNELLNETQRRIAFDDFEDVQRSGPMMAAVACGCVLMLAAFVSLVIEPLLLTALGRSLLMPLHYSSIVVTPVDGPVTAGSDVRIQAEIHGRPLHHARVVFRPAGSNEDWQELELSAAVDRDSQGRAGDQSRSDGSGAAGVASQQRSTPVVVINGIEQLADKPEPPPLGGPVVALLPTVERDLEYAVAGGSLMSDIFTLAVRQPFTLDQFSAVVTPPAYTGLPEESVEAWDVKAPEGSSVTLNFAFNRQPIQAVLRPVERSADERSVVERSVDASVEYVEQRASDDESLVPVLNDTGAFTLKLADLRESGQFVLAAKTGDGIEFESQRIRIRVQADAPPEIRFVNPPEDHEVTPTTEVALAVEASDDFGIRRLGIACKVGDGDMQTLWESTIDVSEGSTPREGGGRGVLYLEDHPVTFQDSVTYYAFVEDNRPGEVHRTTTDLRFIDIRPYKRRYQILPQGGT